MDIEYRSGAFYPSSLKNLPIYRLVQIYSNMRKDGIGFGLSENSIPEKTTFATVDLALASCAKLHSSIVARQEANYAIDSEENGVTPQIQFRKDTPKQVEPKMSKAVRSKIPLDAIISILVEGNPKKRTAAERFAHYRTGMTVGEYCELVGNPTLAVNDVIWDMEHGWIKYEIPVTNSDENIVNDNEEAA